MKKETDRLPLKRKQIKEAVHALQRYHETWEEQNSSRKKSLLEDSSEMPISLSFTLKKIPKLSNYQMIKVGLPHSLVTDATEVCLITGDLDKKDRKTDVESTVQHYKELLAKHGVKNVTEVISLRQLRTEYKPHEAKRNLVGAYDVFLADDKIAQCLPKVLGKFFFKKRKFPLQVNLRTSNLKSHIAHTLSRAVFFLSGRGNTCTAKVARLGFSTKQMIENIEAVVESLASIIPGAWKNINGFYIKTSLSVSIPLYMSLESGNEVELPVPEPVEDVEAEEVTTVRRNKVKVYADGRIVVIPTDESDVSEDDSDYDDDKSWLKRKKTFRKDKISVAEAKTECLESTVSAMDSECLESTVSAMDSECLESTVSATVQTKISEDNGDEDGSALSKKRKLRVDINVSIKKKKKLKEGINASIKKKKEFTVEVNSGKAKSVMAKKKMNKGGFNVQETVSVVKKKKKSKKFNK